MSANGLYPFRGTGCALWLPDSIEVGINGPTKADITDPDVVDLTDAINAMSGFEPQVSTVNVATLRSLQSYQIDGEQTFGTPSLTLVEDEGTGALSEARQAALDALPKGAAGVLVIFRATQEPDDGDKGYWIRLGVSNQVPNLTLDVAAATTAVNFKAQSDLTPFVLGATS